MSDQIFTWLNDEVQLSKKITSFDKDFANGYYFGELLSKYNQQLNFKEFRNSETREAKMKNFNLLQPTFRTLNIKFTPDIVENISTKKDVAPKILYQLKMALEKVNNPADVIINSKAGKYNTVTPQMRINPAIPQFAAQESRFFNQRLNTQNRAQKVVNQELHLQKFELFKIQQDGIIKREKEREQEQEKQLKEQMRKIELNKLQRNMAFQEDWNEKGHEQWKKNQEIIKQRVDADRQFEVKQRQKSETKRLQIKELTKYETNRDIDYFEETLKKKGLIAEEDEEGNIIKKEHKNTISATATMKRIKEKSQVNEFLRKERDKRRRKMIVDQAKLQRDIEVRKREELVLKKLEQQSRQEKEIEYEVWRAYQCKEIIIQNRFVRDEKYKQKNEVNVINAKYKEEELLKILREENEKDILSKLSRQREIEISEKQTNRKSVYGKCRNLIEQLVDLANICYEQQQQQDSEDIDVHFLNDQIKLFIEDKTLLKEKEFRHYETVQNLRNQEASQTESKDFLAAQELQDYLNGRGDWVPQHKFEYQGEDPLNTDEKFIPNTPINNYFLGDLVVNLMKEYYKSEIEEAQREVINHFDWLPLKIAILGYQFSGKKTLANCISRKYGVKLLSVELLMNELLDKYHTYQKQVQQQLRDEKIRSSKSNTRPVNTPAERNEASSQSNRNNKSQSNLVSQQPSQMVEEQNQLIELDQESIELAQKIEKCLYAGTDLPDEYYVQLILQQLHQIHPKVTEEQFLKILAEKDSLAIQDNEQQPRIPNMAQDLQLPPSKEDNFRKALINTEHKYTNGIVLLDFPHTYEQSKLLEKEISGFLPKDEIIRSEFEESVSRAQIIVKPTKVDLLPRSLIKPGVDLVFYVNIDKRESLRRALGRRYDPSTKQSFHLDDNAPPVDNAPLIERLEQIREYGTSELAIVDKNCELDNNFNQLKEWYSMFGNKYEIRTLIEENEEEANHNQEGGIREGTFENEEEEDQQQENAPQEQNNGPVEEEGERVIQENGQEAEQQIVAKPKYNVTQAEQVVWQEVDGTLKIDEVFYQVDQIINKILIAKEQKYEGIQKKLNGIEEKKQQDEEIARIKKENEGKWLFSTRDDILQDLQNFSASIKINPVALKNLVNLWKNTQDLYINTCKNIFFNLNEQKQVILLRFHDIQKRFLELIQRPDSKFMYMRQFQEEYNKFVEENPDMCEEDQTKEELHQRVEDLHDLLYDIIENKRDEASEERNQVIKSGWIEKEMDKFMILIQHLLQAELSRSFSCQQIINDYYVLIQAGELQEIPEFFKNDIVQNQEGLPPVEENNNFPRLEKLVDLTLKLHQGEEEVEEKPGAKKGAAKVPPKKDDKKVVKKGGKNAVEEVEEKKELTPLEKQQKEALNLEKAIFRYRIQVLKDFALSKLKLMKAQSQMLYGKLQDWIDYTFKVENDAINEMDAIFRSYIEEEKKIQKEIQLNYVDIVISHETLNFLTPPPIILPAKELVYQDKFTISQLYIIIEELKSITNENNLIESRALLQLLTRKTINKLSKWDLPETWRENTIQTYQKLILNLDPSEQGYVNGKDICTYICLSGSPIPTQGEEEIYFQKLKTSSSGDDMIEKNQFINTESWFDTLESCQLEINTYLFDRPRYIKELMFYIHKDPETDYIDINSFIQCISSSHYLQQRENEQITTYTDLLLS